MIDAERIVNGEFNSENIENMCFPTIPIYKFATLSILTLGLYDLIWGYGLWKIVQKEFGYKNINPILRVIFMGITNFSLFDIMCKYFQKYNVETFPAVFYAIMYIIFNALTRLPNPYWLITILSTFYVYKIQDKINQVNKINFPNAPVNDWNYTNTIWATLFGIIFFLVIVSFIL